MPESGDIRPQKRSGEILRVVLSVLIFGAVRVAVQALALAPLLQLATLCALSISLTFRPTRDVFLVLKYITGAVCLAFVAAPTAARGAFWHEPAAYSVGLFILSAFAFALYSRVKGESSPEERLGHVFAKALRLALPSGLGAVVGRDLRLFYIAFFMWHAPSDLRGEQSFPSTRNNLPILWSLLVLSTIECGVLHLLFQATAPGLIWTLDIIGLLWIIYLFGLSKSVLFLSSAVRPREVVLRLGALFELTVDTANIKVASAISGGDPKIGLGKTVTLLSGANVELQFHTPVKVSGQIGGARRLAWIRVYFDDAEAFLAALAIERVEFRGIPGTQIPATQN